MRAAIRALGLELLSKNEAVASNTLTAPLYPSKIDAATFLKETNQQGIIFAGGLLPELKTKYFRI